MLDDVLANDIAEQLVNSIEPDFDAPWGTHLCLRVLLNAAPRALLVRELFRPKRLDAPDNKEATPISWSTAVTRAAHDAQDTFARGAAL